MCLMAGYSVTVSRLPATLPNTSRSSRMSGGTTLSDASEFCCMRAASVATAYRVSTHGAQSIHSKELTMQLKTYQSITSLSTPTAGCLIYCIHRISITLVCSSVSGHTQTRRRNEQICCNVGQSWAERCRPNSEACSSQSGAQHP